MSGKTVEVMEEESLRFYQSAAKRATDLAVRSLLGDLAATEQEHESLAADMQENLESSGAKKSGDEAARRLFVLQVIQTDLAGLMDGSVSTLAPVFAAAYATRDSWDAFLVGMAASLSFSPASPSARRDDGLRMPISPAVFFTDFFASNRCPQSPQLKRGREFQDAPSAAFRPPRSTRQRGLGPPLFQ